MNDLDRDVRDYYDGQALDEARIDDILQAARGDRRSDRVWYWRIAAVVAVLLIAFPVLHLELTNRDLSERVLGEIAMNHKKQLAVEVAAVDFESLQTGLDRLEFPIRPPKALVGGMELVGGRYCSIQGSLAAQIKMRDPASGEIRTLYATTLNPDLETVGGQSAVHDGVAISLWTEQGVFFGLAEDPR